MDDPELSGAAQDCPCREGMFPRAPKGRRALLFAAGSAAGAAAMAGLARPAGAAPATAPAGAVLYDVPPDPTKVQGRPVGSDGGYGTRSQFETGIRQMYSAANPYTTGSLTPLADLVGNVTPSGLHYERHHNGVPTIDPAKHSLVVHGLVDTPKRFSMADIKRLPAVTRRHFIECSGNTFPEWTGPTGKTVQITHGLLSTSEWTGVSFSVFAREVGLKPEGTWVLAEGADGAVMTRSIPTEKLMRDGLLAYGQNGEAIRPEQGYPLRLVLPGYEGNTHIKWLRRMQVSDGPFMTREETSKYSDLMADGKAWQFVFEMDAKSVITFPSGDMRLPGAGYYEITGLAWSGRGRVAKVEVSTDGGASWTTASLDSPPEPICTVRFRQPWVWNGEDAVLVSRCTDETGYVQPTRKELVKVRGVNAFYHYNGIQAWAVGKDGRIGNAAA
jgi:sulfane dehydrogenase subunit SoxC